MRDGLGPARAREERPLSDMSGGDVKNFPQQRLRQCQLSRLIKRSFNLSGHRTSVALEPEFWSVLGEMATERSVRMSALVAEVDAGRNRAHSLASALRVLALQWCMVRNTEHANQTGSGEHELGGIELSA